MNGYISVKEAAVRWGVTERQVQRICVAGMIPGAMRFGNSWALPDNTAKPTRTSKTKPGPRPKERWQNEDLSFMRARE